jgi:DNA repair exonuclease SbcCD ATPase subunit
MYQDPETRARVAEQRAKEVEEKAQKLALLVKQEREKWLNELYEKESQIAEYKAKCETLERQMQQTQEINKTLVKEGLAPSKDDQQRRAEDFERKLADYAQGMQILKQEYQKKLSNAQQLAQDSEIKISVLEQKMKDYQEQAKVANERAFDAEVRLGKLQRLNKQLLEERDPNEEDAIDFELAEFETSLQATHDMLDVDIDLDLDSIDLNAPDPAPKASATSPQKKAAATKTDEELLAELEDKPKWNVNKALNGPKRPAPAPPKASSAKVVVKSGATSASPKQPTASATAAAPKQAASIDDELERLILQSTSSKPEKKTDWNSLDDMITSLDG